MNFAVYIWYVRCALKLLQVITLKMLCAHMLQAFNSIASILYGSVFENSETFPFHSQSFLFSFLPDFALFISSDAWYHSSFFQNHCWIVQDHLCWTLIMYETHYWIFMFVIEMIHDNFFKMIFSYSLNSFMAVWKFLADFLFV